MAGSVICKKDDCILVRLKQVLFVTDLGICPGRRQGEDVSMNEESLKERIERKATSQRFATNLSLGQCVIWTR